MITFQSAKERAWPHDGDFAFTLGGVETSADNAAMECLFSLLQNNVLNRHRWDSRQQLRTAIVSWIERTYHHRRRQARLGRLTPVEFETILTPAAGLTA